METYAARFVSMTFSIFLIIAASTLILLRQNQRSNLSLNEYDGSLSKHINIDKTEKHKPESKPTLGETVLYKSDIFKYRYKFRRELKLAKHERETECGTYKKYSAIDCDICVLFVEGLKALAEQGSTQQDVVDFTTAACRELKIEDDRVCAAVTREFKVLKQFPTTVYIGHQ